MQRQCTELAAGQCQGHVTMTAEPPGSPVSEAVRSLEVRWIFPGELEGAVVRWFGRFPAGTEAREDIYLLAPRLPGLSVKVRGGGALEVKAYRGSPGILAVAGRARGRMEFWQKWSFPFTPPSPGSAVPSRLAAGTQEAADQPVLTGQRAGRGARPGAGPGAGMRSGTHRSPHRRPGLVDAGVRGDRPRRICSAAVLRLPPRSCSPTPCPVRNWGQMNPGPMRSGWASGRAPAVTPAREGLSRWRAGPAFAPVVVSRCACRHGVRADPHRRKSGARGMAVARGTRRQLGAPRPGPGGPGTPISWPGADMLFRSGWYRPDLGRGSAVGGTRIRAKSRAADTPASCRQVHPAAGDAWVMPRRTPQPIVGVTHAEATGARERAPRLIFVIIRSIAQCEATFEAGDA